MDFGKVSGSATEANFGDEFHLTQYLFAGDQAEQSTKSAEPTVLMAKSEASARSGRGHRTDHAAGDSRGERPEAQATTRRSEQGDRFAIQSGDSFLIRLAKALAGDVNDLVNEIDNDVRTSTGGDSKDASANNLLISAKTQELAQMVQLGSVAIQSVGGAEKTAAGQAA